MPLTLETLRDLPTVVLHDHLDGGLRPRTVLELCREQGIVPPGGDGADAQDVAGWFVAAADSGSLERYIATFDRTLALLQTAPALLRVAREWVLDLAAEGACYGETRWAPTQHLAGGLSIAQAVDAVQEGLDEGAAAVRAQGRPILVGQILCFMRQLEPVDELVDVAAARRETGVWGMDLAGPEAGFPAHRFRAQLDRARALGLRITIHAGEADGPSSILDALESGAERLGHGVRLAEDIGPDQALGAVASRVRAEGICLEVCPTSNLQTGAARDLASHPAGALLRGGFAVSISPDNRLMSGTDGTRELALLGEEQGWTLEDVRRSVLAGIDAGFGPEELRRALREEVIVPAFDAAAQDASA